MKLQLLCASLLLSGAAWSQNSVAKPIVLKTPCNYQILAMSNNGKWACGAYVDMADATYGFLWNLESGVIELLNPSITSVARSVSDNGIVTGYYTDNSYNANGASVTLGGYWADHQWHRLEMPSGTVEYAVGHSISPDGKFISGVVNDKGLYTGYIWENGKIKKELVNNKACAPYAVSPDGQLAAGWMYSTKSNRRACLWETNGEVTWLCENVGPWNSVRTFSPDGKKLLFFGDWVTVGDKKGVNAIYDIATRTKKAIVPLSMKGQFQLFDLSDNEMVVGANDNRGYIWKDGKAVWADEYLTANGVDLAAEHVVTMPETDYPCVFRASTVSADEKVMGFQFYNDDVDASGNLSSGLQSMIVKFDQTTTGLCPVSVSASQMSGLGSVYVSWKDNVAAQGVAGYNIYRDGVKINTAPVTSISYVDANPGLGEHKYAVTAIYGGLESPKSDETALIVAEKAIPSPSSLFTQQRGYNNAYLSWSAPATNFGSLTYFDAEKADIQGFGLSSTGSSYEVAIQFDSLKTAAYKGQKITSVGFYPLSEQGGWKINFYTRDASGKLQRLYTQPVTQQLNYGERNDVKLTTPQSIPDGDLIIALEIAVTSASQNINGIDYGRAVEGKSDILRMVDEDDFYSIGQYFQSNGYLYQVTWALDATVAPENADMEKDKVDHYDVYSDGTCIGSSSAMSFFAPSLTEGAHTMGVKAVYADGEVSDAKTATLTITPDDTKLCAVDSVAVAPRTATSIHAEWTEPTDNDLSRLQYSADKASDTAVKGAASNNYGYMAGVVYPSNMFRGRDGYVISSVRFYPLNDATFTAFIYKDDQLVSETEVDGYKLNAWNNVKLATPVTVDSRSAYKLVIDCYDVTPDTPALAVDDAAPVDGYSNLYSLDGESWNALYSTQYISGNWLMGLNIESPMPMALPVAGYDVNIDGKKMNTAILANPAYDYDFGSEDSKLHTISVDVYYTVKAQSVQGGVTRFNIGAAGIGDNTIQRIEIRQGDNELAVSGDGVVSVQLYSTSGAEVASASGNTVSLNGIAPGVYMVKAVVNHEVITRKIQIVK